MTFRLYSALALVLALTTQSASGAAFYDVSQDSWEYQSVNYLQSQGIIQGYSNGSFYPNQGVTRAEFVKMALEAADIPVSGTSCFRDVPKNSWYAPYVCTAANLGLVKGYGDGNFRPEKQVAFSEAAMIAARTFFGPVPADAVWYRPAIALLGAHNAIPTSLRSLGDPITRGESAYVLYALMDGEIDDHTDDDDGEARNDELEITVTVDDKSPEADDVIEYRIRIENRDNDDIEIDVTAELDDEMEFVSANEDGEEDDEEVEWENVEIDEDDDITLRLRVRLDGDLDDGDTVRLRVEADDLKVTKTTKIDDDNDSDDDDDDLSEDDEISVSITDSDDTVEVGDTITYRIKIENKDDDDTFRDIEAILDRSLDFVSASDDGEEEDEREVRWDDIRIDEDDTRTILLTARVNSKADDGDSLRLRVDVEGVRDDETTRVEDDDDDDDDDDIELSIDDSPDPAEVGDVVRYQIRVRNDDSESKFVDVKAILDEGMSFSSAFDGGDFDGDDEVLWEDVRLDGYETETLRLDVRINNDAEDKNSVRLEVESGDAEATESTEIED